MASSSITIRIDYGAESGGGAAGSVVGGGAVPTPESAGGSAAVSQSGGAVPTPFDSQALGVGHADAGGPAPSPSLVPGGTAGAASGSSDPGSVPTPFSAGGFSSPGAGQPGDTVPTPMDSVHGRVIGDHAPAPELGSLGHPEQTLPAPSHPDDPSGKKGRK
jgi:hypothetical protein